jgi:hypothetical protein
MNHEVETLADPAAVAAYADSLPGTSISSTWALAPTGTTRRSCRATRPWRSPIAWSP